jgi:hypothetical protein
MQLRLSGFVFTAVISVLGCAGARSDPPRPRDEVQQILIEIEHEPSGMHRGMLAGRLWDAVRAIRLSGNLDSLDGRSVDGIIALLGERDTALSACMALSELGERGRRAIPAIQAAIDSENANSPHVQRLRGCLGLIEAGAYARLSE